MARHEGKTVDQTDMGEDLQKILITEEQIDSRLAELAAQIDKDYEGKDILVVGVLKGAVMVMADLVRKFYTPLTMDWMVVSSSTDPAQSPPV